MKNQIMREVNKQVKKKTRAMSKVIRNQAKESNTTYDREDILSDIWAANKKVVDGKWYVELSEVANILGVKL